MVLAVQQEAKKYIVKKSKKYRSSNPEFYVTGKIGPFNSRLIQGQLGWYFLSIPSSPWYHSTYSSKSVTMKQVRMVSISNYSSVVAAIVSLFVFLVFPSNYFIFINFFCL